MGIELEMETRLMDEQTPRQSDLTPVRRVIRIRPVRRPERWDAPPAADFDEDWEPEAVEDDGEDAPYWTPARVVYMVVLVITLVAFLAYTVAPAISALLNPPAPPPPIFGPRDRA